MVIRELAKVAFSADVHIATGTVFEYQRWATKQSGYCDGATWFVGDFNGDGKMDMMKEWDSNGKLNADVHISTGGQFEYQRWATGQGGYSDTMQWFVGDFNGDGKTDLMKVWNNNGKITADVHVSESSSDLIGSISKEGRTIIGIEYIPAPQISGAVASAGKSYPDIANSSPLPLVTQLMRDDGLGHTITDRYSYSNSMIHVGQLYEQETLGFAWIEKQNEVTGSLRTYYRQDDVDLRLMVDQEEVRGTDGKLYTVKQYEYQKRPNAGNSEINFIYTANEGLFYLLDGISKRIGLEDALAKAFPNYWEEIFMLACFMVSTHDPLMYCEDWIEGTESLPVGRMTSQRISELLAVMKPEQRTDFLIYEAFELNLPV
jgi:hypothetical protein